MPSPLIPVSIEGPRGAASTAARTRMQVVIGGHVDHGKSTIIGRLLADTHSLPDGKLAQVKALCQRTAKPFEYAFLIDALRDEQAQGITIDAARIFFKTARRDYLLIDAPGHIEFLKNMVTGAARAEAALLVIDAKDGLQENSRRHAYLMSVLGIRQLVVLVNKMDLVEYGRAVFNRIEADYRAFLENLNIRPACFIPVCGRTGENLAAPARAMPWYEGPTLLDALDRFQSDRPPVQKPFRMPVQDVYKFTNEGDDRRIVAGTIETGTVAVGDELAFYPSGKKGIVKSFEAFHRACPAAAGAGQAVGFTLAEQVYVARGEIATAARETPPLVSSRLRASVFWLGRNPLVMQKDYTIRLGTARATMRVADVHRVIDSSDLASSEQKRRVERHEVGECTLELSRALAFDLADEMPTTGRFVVVDDYEICGGGIVLQGLPDKQTWVREKVMLREDRWEPSVITWERRAARFSQRPALLLITGTNAPDRKALARHLEARLFDDGRAVFFLGIANVLYGVDADIAREREQRQEHMRRLAEVSHLMLEAGMILIVTAAEIAGDDLALVSTVVQPERIVTVWVGERVTTDISCDLLLTGLESDEDAAEQVQRLLHAKGVIVHPW
jgi:bifunctional enzyme CysN/CysC